MVSVWTIRVRNACVYRPQNIKGQISRAFDYLLSLLRADVAYIFWIPKICFQQILLVFYRLDRFCPFINPSTRQHRSCAHHPWLLLRICLDWVGFIYFSDHQKKNAGDKVWVSLPSLKCFAQCYHVLILPTDKASPAGSAPHSVPSWESCLMYILGAGSFLA